MTRRALFAAFAGIPAIFKAAAAKPQPTLLRVTRVDVGRKEIYLEFDHHGDLGIGPLPPPPILVPTMGGCYSQFDYDDLGTGSGSSMTLRRR